MTTEQVQPTAPPVYVRVHLEPFLALECPSCGCRTPMRMDVMPVLLTPQLPDMLDGLPLHGWHYGPGDVKGRNCARCQRFVWQQLETVYLIRYLVGTSLAGTPDRIHIEAPASWLSPYSDDERLRDIFRPIREALEAQGAYDDPDW